MECQAKALDIGLGAAVMRHEGCTRIRAHRTHEQHATGSAFHKPAAKMKREFGMRERAQPQRHGQLVVLLVREPTRIRAACVYEATSVSELTEAMGITAPTLYSFFGNKKQLFLEAVDRYQSEPVVLQ